MTLLEDPRPTRATRSHWAAVCLTRQLTPGRGAAALIDGEPVAIFLLDDGRVFAVDNVDPCSGASVLSRGLVGCTEIDGEAIVYVASPLRKERFDLLTGRCLDADTSIRTWSSRVSGAFVEIARIPSSPSNEHETTP